MLDGDTPSTGGEAGEVHFYGSSIDKLRVLWLDEGMNITIGSTVIRKQGRPVDIGRRGTVTSMSSPDVVGSAGDVLVTVVTSDGETFNCYTRQLELA
jgi:hypothetical protein